MVFLVCLVSFGVVPFKRVEKGWKNLLVLTADKPAKGRTAKCEKTTKITLCRQSDLCLLGKLLGCIDLLRLREEKNEQYQNTIVK